MIPYADFLYFGILLYVLVPSPIFAVSARAARPWILVSTLAMLALQYGGTVQLLPQVRIREIWIVAGCALFEIALVLWFVRVRGRTAHRWPFYTALALSLAPLVAAKLSPLLAAESRFGFLGISYVTFRVLDVVFCVQDRVLSSVPPGQLFAYLFFFPTISAGPIDRYRRFDTDWKRRRTRAELLQDLDVGVHRIFTGFFYKFIAAALIERYWLARAEAGTGAVAALSYMYAYTIHLFFDFAGYSAFAIGVGYFFGVHTPENFDRPFLARNIRDFWNRWHITLSWWLRDHVYMRFVMAATKGRWFGSRYLASYLGLLLAFGLMGLWHGPAAHFLLYGLYHGILLCVYEAFTRWSKRGALWGDGRLWDAASRLATFHCVCFGFLIFSGHWMRAAPRDPAGAYEGRLERASCEEIAGWARNAGEPGVPVSVDLWADGTKITTVRADLFRPDLAAAGKGSGYHAFVLAPPASLKDGWPHAIEATIAGSPVALSSAVVPIACVVGVKAMDGFEGAHEDAGCEAIGGWARDTTRPDRPVEVDIYDGEKRVATVRADQPRERSGNRGQEAAGHGFHWPTPPELRDARMHSISVRLAGSNVTLSDTPRILNCPVSSGMDTPAVGREERAEPTAAPAPVHAYTDNRNGTISDLSTGLMWEKKVAMDGVRDGAALNDADNCHPWAGRCGPGGAECRVHADCGDGERCRAEDCQSAAESGLTVFEWVARLNATRFAGYDDWRLPTSQELHGIVNPFEEKDPATVAAFKGLSCGGACTDVGDPACSCTQAGLYWAAPTAGPRPDESWMMFFYCNGHLFLDLKANRFYVRAVRVGR